MSHIDRFNPDKLDTFVVPDADHLPCEGDVFITGFSDEEIIQSRKLRSNDRFNPDKLDTFIFPAKDIVKSSEPWPATDDGSVVDAEFNEEEFKKRTARLMENIASGQNVLSKNKIVGTEVDDIIDDFVVPARRSSGRLSREEYFKFLQESFNDFFDITRSDD